MKKTILAAIVIILMLDLLLPFGVRAQPPPEDVVLNSDGSVIGTNDIQFDGLVYFFKADISGIVYVKKKQYSD
jgi:hypothetical protein